MLGGVFDPVHAGHLAAARAARRALNLHEVWMMVTGRPPHKHPLTPLRHRLAMLRVAVGDRRGMKISLEEAGRSKPRYTIETLRRLAKGHPRTAWVYILGGDAALDFRTWKSWKKFPQWCQLAVVARPGVPMGRVKRAMARCGFVEGREFVTLPVQTRDISSTEIRRMKGLTRNISRHLPAGVAAYIRRHRVYGERPHR